MSEELLRELIKRIMKVLKEDVPTNEHPLRILHHRAKTVYELCSQALEIVNGLIDDVKAKVESRREELRRKYGPGYITVKTVRNRQGRRYSYIIYRTKQKDIYVNDDQIPRLRRKLRELYQLREKLRQVRNTSWAYMKSTEPYA